MEIMILQELANADVLGKINQLQRTIEQLKDQVNNMSRVSDEGWMTLEKASSALGLNPPALYQRIRTNHWPEGVVWKKVGECRNSPIYVHLAECRNYMINRT